MRISSIAAANGYDTANIRQRAAAGDFAQALAAQTAGSVENIPPTPAERLDAAMAAYRREATMTPMERARRDVLKDMKLTEEQIAAMPPKDREATEKTIATEVAKRLRLAKPVHTEPPVTTDAFIARMANHG